MLKIEDRGTYFIYVNGFPSFEILEPAAEDAIRLFINASDLLTTLETAKQCLIDCAPPKFDQPGWDVLALIDQMEELILRTKGKKQIPTQGGKCG